jgi:hypothetical protein
VYVWFLVLVKVFVVVQFVIPSFPLPFRSMQRVQTEKRYLDAETMNTFVLCFSFPNRECPPEFRKAVSTLIFAAARYPDLPELCDLRHIFTEKFGNFVEHFVSREVRKMMLICCYQIVLCFCGPLHYIHSIIIQSFCLQFIRKLDSTEFTNEERLQVMQSIAEESSISFDAKELQLKLWATPETEHVSAPQIYYLNM